MQERNQQSDDSESEELNADEIEKVGRFQDAPLNPLGEGRTISDLFFQRGLPGIDQVVADMGTFLSRSFARAGALLGKAGEVNSLSSDVLLRLLRSRGEICNGGAIHLASGGIHLLVG